MVLVWKGWGILSGIIAVAAYVVGLAVSELQGGWSFFATMAEAAVINWVSRLVAESITPRSECDLAQVEQSTLDE